MLKTLLELIKKENGIVIGRTRNKGKRLLRFIIGNIGYVALHTPSGQIKLIRCIGLVSKESIRYRLRKARRAGVYFKPVFNRTIYGIEVIE